MLVSESYKDLNMRKDGLVASMISQSQCTEKVKLLASKSDEDPNIGEDGPVTGTISQSQCKKSINQS